MAVGGLLAVGGFLFLAGTVGLLRFPDVYSRLHALTKADNLGLGLLVIGMAVDAATWSRALELFLVWSLVMLGSTTACHLNAQAALRSGVAPWSRR